MTTNNKFDGLKYQEAKRTAVDDIAKGYKDNGKTVEPERRSTEEILREQFEKDPASLTPIQRLSLGFAEINKKNEGESQARQKAANDIKQQHEDKKKQDQEMISANSEEFEQLAKQMEAMKAEFQKMNGAGSGGE